MEKYSILINGFRVRDDQMSPTDTVVHMTSIRIQITTDTSSGRYTAVDSNALHAIQTGQHKKFVTTSFVTYRQNMTSVYTCNITFY